MVAKEHREFVPDRGDIVWLDFSPSTGHEHTGRRPAITLSPLKYNRLTGLGLFCPITSKEKGYPFEVLLPKTPQVAGIVLADQIRSLDWRARRAALIHRAPNSVTEEILEKVRTLL